MTERQIQLAILAEIKTAIVCAAPNYTPAHWWECDLWAVTRAGYAVEYEIKLTAQDFRADAKKHSARWVRDADLRGRWLPDQTKHEALQQCVHRPSRFFYVMPRDLAEELKGEIPEWAGLGSAHVDGHYRRVSFIKNAPKLGKHKASLREIRLCQTRMWYRYWESLRTIERMRDDRERMAANRAPPPVA